MRFSTKDQDNDKWPKGNYAQRYRGGWWYSGGGHESNLNGLYLQKGGTNKRAQAASWKYFKGRK